MRPAILLVTLAVAPLTFAPAGAKTVIVRGERGDVDTLAKDTALWTWDRDTAEKKFATLGAAWTSSAKDTLRTNDGGKIFGLQAGETLLRFDAKTGKPDSLEILLYNRGDKGDMADKDFIALLEKATKAIDEASGTKSKRFINERSAIKPGEALWAAKNATYALEWSPEKIAASNHAEFVKLILMPAGRAAAYHRDNSQRLTSFVKVDYKSADHLETNAAGDKWIKDVPMVDQGQKGYCAVASTERVLRQFGLPVDQHDLAQLAEASGSEGTDPTKLVAALRRHSGRLRLNPTVLMEINEQFLNSLVNDYNKAARKTKASPLPKVGTQEFYMTFAFDRLDGPTLLAGRGGNASAVRSFEDKIAAQIDKGLPVMWGLILGYAPENPALPQTRGGHMRLIIGYNKKTHQIIYTDSWGAGHERKSMSSENAFAVTEMLVVMSPK